MEAIETYTIPVNPEYSWEITPQEQADYVNPVELNNKLIEFENEHARIALKLVKDQKRRAELNVQLKSAELEVSNFRNKLLRTNPPHPNDRKTNILLEAYVSRIVFESGQTEKYEALAFAVKNIEAQLELIEAEIEGGKTLTFMLRDFYENIKTHLAFRKHEWRQTTGLPGA